MGKLFRSIIRSSSFLSKEVLEILRQPRLIASLVLGPFLILFLFGIGYQNQTRTLNAIIVVPQGSAISAEQIRGYSETMISAFNIVGASSDLNSALTQLHQGKIDMVIAEPPNAMNDIKTSHQAVFTIYHNEIDPTQADYIDYLGWLFVNAINQQVLLNFTEQGQKNTQVLHNDLQEAHQNIVAVRQAVQSGNNALAQQKQQDLAVNIDTIASMAGSSLGIVDSLQPTDGSNGSSGPPVQTTVNDLNQNSSALRNNEPTDQRLTRLDKMDKDIISLDNKITVLQSIQPNVIVSPFSNNTKSVANFKPTMLDFFVPAVLALLLQHIAVTFGALSIVRERYVGTVELFRASPISAGEVLFGKYVSYMIFGSFIAFILAILLAFGLHARMLGNWWFEALVVAVLLFTSLGFGFVISLISQTDSQAVQYSMILLLASVFFSGFVMGLDRLSNGVKILSWLLPTTYGTILLRNIQLRGYGPDWLLLGGLLGIGLVLMVISGMLMRRLIGSSR